ncbi:hypothetical protein [Streptomyces sp. HUCO-GS316]|nr:hypothetical protein [Streptomyces sp. HUCO-GS316]
MPDTTETWTCPVLRVDGDTLCVYPDDEAERANRVLPVVPSSF